MKSISRLIRRLIREEDGLETVEYAIIAGLIVAGAAATIAVIGIWVNDQFEELKANTAGDDPAPE